MVEIEIKLPPRADPIKRIDAAIKRCGLTIQSKGTLKTYPGCTHWHCKLGKEKGTLEITWWPSERRAWFKIQAGRDARWIRAVIPKLKHRIQDRSAARLR